MTGPRVALTAGDPFGIGPEVTLDALAALPPRRRESVALFASGAHIARLAARLDALPARAGRPRLAPLALERLCVAPLPDPGDAAAAPSSEGGAASLAALEAAVAAIAAGACDRLLTGPISKEAWALAGHPFPGQTEWLARAAGLPEDAVEMVFLGDAFSCVLATRHLPLSAVPSALSAERLVNAATRAADLLDRCGTPVRRISFLALNPHASDGGLIGHDETEIFRPAVDRLAVALGPRGIVVDGPHPADGFFAAGGPRDGRLVVAPYHDLGLVPFKMLHPRRGINATAGLPYVRFSVDHGTAFDIAGRGIADAGAMLHCLERLMALRDEGPEVRGR